MPKYKLVVAPDIKKQLEYHMYFIMNVSYSAAGRFLSEYEVAARRLANSPYENPLCDDPGLPEGYRRALFAKWYKIYYTVEGDTVYIDAVADGRSIR